MHAELSGYDGRARKTKMCPIQEKINHSNHLWKWSHSYVAIRILEDGEQAEGDIY